MEGRAPLPHPTPVWNAACFTSPTVSQGPPSSLPFPSPALGENGVIPGIATRWQENLSLQTAEPVPASPTPALPPLLGYLVP